MPTVTFQDDEGVDVLGAFSDSVKLLIEHTIRIAAQEKTRRELGGPFWSDYRHRCEYRTSGKTPMRGG